MSPGRKAAALQRLESSPDPDAADASGAEPACDPLSAEDFSEYRDAMMVQEAFEVRL